VSVVRTVIVAKIVGTVKIALSIAIYVRIVLAAKNVIAVKIAQTVAFVMNVMIVSTVHI
jgi:hypothetical protein